MSKNQKNEKLFNCPCGMTIKDISKYAHMRTNRHIIGMMKRDNNSEIIDSITKYNQFIKKQEEEEE